MSHLQGFDFILVLHARLSQGWMGKPVLLQGTNNYFTFHLCTEYGCVSYFFWQLISVSCMYKHLYFRRKKGKQHGMILHFPPTIWLFSNVIGICRSDSYRFLVLRLGTFVCLYDTSKKVNLFRQIYVFFTKQYEHSQSINLMTLSRLLIQFQKQA